MYSVFWPSGLSFRYPHCFLHPPLPQETSPFEVFVPTRLKLILTSMASWVLLSALITAWIWAYPPTCMAPPMDPDPSVLSYVPLRFPCLVLLFFGLFSSHSPAPPPLPPCAAGRCFFLTPFRLPPSRRRNSPRLFLQFLRSVVRPIAKGDWRVFLVTSSRSRGV